MTLAADFLNATPYGTSGFDIILYYNARNDEREAACFLFKEGLESLDVAGEINVGVQALDWPTYLDSLYGKALPVFFLGWGPDYADPDDYVNPFLHSDGVFPYFLSISNATLDDMIIDAAFELNETLRAEMYFNISMVSYDNAYYLWTAQPTNFHVERAWVDGYYFNPMYSQFYFYAMSK
jgi:peptide/nickel transport system substrate-binding protein